MTESERKEFEFALGYVLKLAESGRTLDQVEEHRSMKRADALEDWYTSKGQYRNPELTKRTYDRIYSKTRAKLRREADRSQAGRHSILWQGFRNPVTGKLRIPISFGSKNVNTENASMTPAQANLVSLLTKNRKVNDFKKLQKRVNRRSGDFEFIGDPTVFNIHASRLTNRGKEDFKKAYRYVHGYEPSDYQVDAIAERLFGTHAGFAGQPHIFERYNSRKI